MPEAPDGRFRFVSAALVFAGLVAASAGLLALTAWLEGSGVSLLRPATWRAALESGPGVEAAANAAEVVAAVLAMAITVVAIVVELAATRYTHRIPQLFVREPVNGAVMGFLVVATLLCVWIGVLGGSGEASGGGVALALGLASLGLLLLLPYFAYVLAFVSPVPVIRRLRRGALRAVQRAVRSGGTEHRAQVLEAIEELEDVARGASEKSDRGIAIAAVDALFGVLRDYGPLRPQLPGSWFTLDGVLARDPDLVSLDEFAAEEILQKGTWLETKVLRQCLGLFAESLNRARDVCQVIAMEARRIAADGLGDRPERLELGVLFLNSFLRAAVNARDVRTCFYVLHQYRRLAEKVCAAGRGDVLMKLTEHLRFYGQLGYDQGLPFLLETVAFDLGTLIEHAVQADSPEVDALLEEFLRVDREARTEEQELRLLGVRSAQLQLATLFLLRGDEARAERICDDLRQERRDRLARVRDELLAQTSPQYWEFTDRGANFRWLPPERRALVDEVFRRATGAPAAAQSAGG